MTIISSTMCTEPISALMASPFNLPWGSSIYAQIIATNVIGSSANSALGNNAVILTSPDAPLNLENSPATTNAYRILVKWQPGVNVGGTPVIDYQL